MPLPVDYQTCTVTGSWVDIATSDPGSGYVVFTPRATRITTGSEVIVLPTARRVWLEGGAINIELPATDDPDVAPVDWTYQVVETIGGVEYPAYDIEAPAGGTVDLSSAIGVGSAGTIIAVQGAPGPQPDLSTADPQPLGVAAPGVDVEASRSDHVHPMPSAADVDAVPITAVGLLAGETNRGDWSGATAYVPGDVVHDHDGDGQVYVCTAATTNEQPSLTAAKWTAIDGTGREFAVGAGSHAGDSALSIGPGATSDGGGLSVGPYAAAEGYGLSVGLYATSGVAGLSVGLYATSGAGGLAIGPGATSGDYEVNVSGIYKGTVDSGDPTVPTGASIATGFVDLPETADTSNPAAGSQRLVARTDGLYVRDEAGAEVGPIGAGGTETLPATIIDAAGDLIIGTAADTAARLAVGTTGQVLTSNGTTAAWANPLPRPNTGLIVTPGNGSTTTAAIPAHASGRCCVRIVGPYRTGWTLDRIGVDVTGTTANTEVRFAVWADNGYGRPGTLLYLSPTATAVATPALWLETISVATTTPYTLIGAWSVGASQPTCRQADVGPAEILLNGGAAASSSNNYSLWGVGTPVDNYSVTPASGGGFFPVRVVARST